jgi:hypothetical protein
VNLTFALDAAIGAIANVLRDLNLDEYEIRRVVTALSDESHDLGDSSFHRAARIDPAAFGGTETAQALGTHHHRAYSVIDETIRGMVVDLEEFRDNVRNAVELVTRADETAASDLDARRQRVANAMTNVALNSAADRAHDEARNSQLDGGE